MEIIQTIVLILLLFSATIFVHELGHFLVARWCGLTVEVFSLGFGPALWKRKIGAITYKIGIIPFGGYVALPQLDPDGTVAARETDKPVEPAPPGKRILVSLAGATGNVVLAIALAFLLHALGTGSEAQRGCIVGYVERDAEAQVAGLGVGDRILSVNGRSVNSWDAFMINSALAESVALEVVSPDGVERELHLATQPLSSGGRTVLGVGKSSPSLVSGVTPGSAAEEAGIRRKDVIVELAGQKIYSFEQLVDVVNQNAEQEVPVVVQRGGALEPLRVRPRMHPEYGRAMIGVEFNRFDLSLRPLDQLTAWAAPVFRILGALVTPSESRHAARALSGPVGILGLFWMAAQTHWMLALWLTGMLNVNLAILNLLPLPVLDGGHILLALWEAIFRRRPSPKFVHGLWQVFALLLISLMLLLTVKDVGRVFRMFGRRSEPPAEAPANAAPVAPE